MKTEIFFSPGKLLLTSEYVVLDGALALAVPTKLGQDFICDEITDGKSEIFWEAYHENHFWLKVKINYQTWQILDTNLPENAGFILKVLKNVQKLSLVKFKENHSYNIRTNLQFPSNFGLGSSSTLMNNLADWAQTDAFELNEMSLGGSGYDIAVAQERSAILYRKSSNERTVQRISFRPAFAEDLIFIHLNQKQDSRAGINLYKSKPKTKNIVDEFSAITNQVLKAETLHDFSDLMTIHEKRLSRFLELETVKNRYFKDCPVFVKSLGAWGGDFVLSAKFGDYENYFSDLNFGTVLGWDDLIG